MNSKQTPAGSYGRCKSPPSVTKKDIEKVAKSTVLEAVRMIDVAMYNHSIQNPDIGEMALEAIQNPNESETGVEAYRESHLSKEAYITPKAGLGKDPLHGRIEMYVNDFAAKLQQDMRDEQAQRSAKNLQISSQSTPIKTYNATPGPPTMRSQKMPKTPRKVPPSQPMSKADRLIARLSESGAIELSPTGFVHFLRHSDDDDNWERVSENWTPEPEVDPKADGRAAGKMGLFSSLFGK